MPQDVSESVKDRETRRFASGSVKVHVNREEVDFLEFLVRRYRADVDDLRRKGKVRIGEETNRAYAMAEDLLVELGQAGS